MKKFVAAVLILFVCSRVLFAADLKTYQASYDKQMSDIVLEHGATISRLNASYSKSMNNLSERAIGAGDLDTMQAVMAEIKRFEAEKTVHEEASQVNAEIKKIQQAYIRNFKSMELAKAKKVLSLSSKYDSALGKLQISLAKQQKIDEAVSVKTERESVKTSREMIAAQTILSSAKPEEKRPKSLAPAVNKADKAPIKRVAAASLLNGLILHYNFDLDKKGKVTDKSKKRYHGMVRGKPAKVQGASGTALEFDGVTDFVELPKNSALLNLPDSDFSICTWYKPNATPTGEFGNGKAAIVQRQGYHIGIAYTDATSFRAEHWFDSDMKDGSVKPFSVESGPDYDIGGWYHVAELVSVKDKSIKLCVNGKVVAEEVSPYEWKSHLNDTRGWRVGIAAPGCKTCRNAAAGAIDDVRIYDRTLSEAEVAKIYELTAPAK